MTRSLSSQLRRKHEPKCQAQPHGKVRLDEGKVNETDEPGDKHQRSMVKNVVGNQQKEKPAKGARHAPKDTRQSEMLQTDPEAMNAQGDKQGACYNHDKGKALLAQEPMLAASHYLS